ncbi:SIR2 family NAD-dependent protein deacylase [Aeromonas hydrophila]|uniref:SIR2 family NAD-dependent protein deacylase n=1 Tax=Aeromonas hydrophila TaxID=644 RepID=UPI001CC5A098|nr:Sir2 family NAD-dependent protein deacetylase [Aeromonas hydrophila]
MSEENGAPTFRGINGLWCQSDNIRYSQVSSLDKNLTELLLFHNRRRRSMLKTSPSQAHYLMAELQKKHHVRSITQNIDDLHERAGSHSVTHLHGSIQFLVPKGFRHKKYRRPWCDDIYAGDCCPHTGSQFRTDVILFGEKFIAIGRLAAGSVKWISW